MAHFVCASTAAVAGRKNSLSRRTTDDGLRWLSRIGIQWGNFACALSPSLIAFVLPPDPQQHQSQYRDESSQTINDCKVHGTHLSRRTNTRPNRNDNAASDRGRPEAPLVMGWRLHALNEQGAGAARRGSLEAPPKSDQPGGKVGWSTSSFSREHYAGTIGTRPDFCHGRSCSVPRSQLDDLVARSDPVEPDRSLPLCHGRPSARPHASRFPSRCSSIGPSCGRSDGS